MSMSQPEICTECGKGRLKPKACPDRSFTYQKGTILPFPSNLEVPTCSNCGAWFVDKTLRNEVKHYLKDRYGL